MQHFDKDKLEKEALRAIKKHNLFFIVDVASFLPCSRATFYNQGLDKLDSIKEALEQNKIKTKNSMRSKWYQSDNATLQLALMKLISTDEERQKLSQSYVDLSSKGEKLEITNDPDALKTLLATYKTLDQNTNEK